MIYVSASIYIGTEIAQEESLIGVFDCTAHYGKRKCQQDLLILLFIKGFYVLFFCDRIFMHLYSATVSGPDQTPTVRLIIPDLQSSAY